MMWNFDFFRVLIFENLPCAGYACRYHAVRGVVKKNLRLKFRQVSPWSTKTGKINTFENFPLYGSILYYDVLLLKGLRVSSQERQCLA